nr:LPXTG cell wall anchor domain-containing protein [Vagococcus penaei]
MLKKGILPSTGGLGVLLFVLIGGTLMVGAYLWLRRGPKKVRRI